MVEQNPIRLMAGDQINGWTVRSAVPTELYRTRIWMMRCPHCGAESAVREDVVINGCHVLCPCIAVR